MFYLTKHNLAKVGVAGSSLVFHLQPTLKGACVKFECGCKGLEGGAVQSKYILRQFHGYSWWQKQAFAYRSWFEFEADVAGAR